MNRELSTWCPHCDAMLLRSDSVEEPWINLDETAVEADDVA